MNPKIKIDDLTVRDGNQSLIATRMTKEDILKIVSELDKVGFDTLEVWGGATFDSAMRFLGESPWEMLRDIRRAAPNTKLSMLLRGQNIVGYKHYTNDTLERFIRLTLENGIDIIRCFDALNDPNNVRNSFKYIKKHGGIVEGAIAYTVSPVHDIDYYVNLTKTYESMGADCICIKDMAGILLPEVAYDLITAMKATTDLPITLHTHTTAGATNLVILEAMRAGVDRVEGCLAPLSGGTAHLADETILRIAKLMDRPTELDVQALAEASEVASAIIDKYIDAGLLKPKALIPNPKILRYQVPGGMLSNLMSQLEKQKQMDKLDLVLKEVPAVRKDLGYPPLVTPLSQMVGTQAVFNVLLGERYKMIPNEIKEYLIGRYGVAPGDIDTELFKDVIESYSAVAESQEPEPDFATSKANLEAAVGTNVSEEDVIAYILFPKQTVDLLTGQVVPDTIGNSQKKPAPAKVAEQNAPVEFTVYI